MSKNVYEEWGMYHFNSTFPLSNAIVEYYESQFDKNENPKDPDGEPDDEVVVAAKNLMDAAVEIVEAATGVKITVTYNE